MSLKRIILELGTGNDLYGENYTKASIRAVQDALHHSSLTLFKSLEIDPNSMFVEITVGVQSPEDVDTNMVSEQIPYGRVQVTVVQGGMNIPAPDNHSTTVVATVAVAAFLELPDEKFTLS